MDNHYHFVIHTRRGNLSRLMQQLNGVWGQKAGKAGIRPFIITFDIYIIKYCRLPINDILLNNDYFVQMRRYANLVRDGAVQEVCELQGSS